MSSHTPTQLDASDLPWIDTRNLDGVRQATADERATIGVVLSGLHIRDDFGARPFLIHDGDLHVRGHLASSGALLVRGDLYIDGIYHDDCRGPYGILAVLGDLRARDVLNGASLYVRGDLHVSGVMLATNTDMALQVEGQLHAEGVVVWDKGVQFTPGAIGFLFDRLQVPVEQISAEDRSLREAALCRLCLELISSGPRIRDEIFEYDSIWRQPIDLKALTSRLLAAQPITRATPASPELPRWLATAISFASADDELLALIGRDPLVDQLMAAREVLGHTVANALAAGHDPIVLAWLENRHPHALTAAEAGDP